MAAYPFSSKALGRLTTRSEPLETTCMLFTVLLSLQRAPATLAYTPLFTPRLSPIPLPSSPPDPFPPSRHDVRVAEQVG